MQNITELQRKAKNANLYWHRLPDLRSGCKKHKAYAADRRWQQKKVICRQTNCTATSDNHKLGNCKIAPYITPHSNTTHKQNTGTKSLAFAVSASVNQKGPPQKPSEYYNQQVCDALLTWHWFNNIIYSEEEMDQVENGNFYTLTAGKWQHCLH